MIRRFPAIARRQQNFVDHVVVNNIKSFRRQQLLFQHTRFYSASSINKNNKSNNSNLLQIQQTVHDAIQNKRPVVALESTIVVHGMPYPQNYELALEVQSIIESKGVVPATIAIRNGTPRIGLSNDELHDLALAGQENRAKKCTTRDLPILLGQQQQQQQMSTNTTTIMWGATTVASTMRLAYLAGIQTFVTGGIGGVHRNGENSMDVSADLTEMGQTPVIVVSAGIKSILDIQRTMEVLETNNVPTVGWQTNEFPAFFSPKSGVPCPARVDEAETVARSYWAARHLQLPQGMLVAVPNNDPAGANVERAIQAALLEAEQSNIRGQDVTPFILKRVAEKTQGDSLRSNMALVRNNAMVGADIAIAIAELYPRN
jgi:pseudouridine-5'-phosphate glycosidase